MSADNWQKCPACEHKQAKQREELEQLKTRADKANDLATWKDAQAKIDALPRLKETLREDYEFYFDSGFYFEDIELHVDYSASCSVCGFSFSFNRVETMLKGLER